MAEWIEIEIVKYPPIKSDGFSYSQDPPIYFKERVRLDKISRIGKGVIYIDGEMLELTYESYDEVVEALEDQES